MLDKLIDALRLVEGAYSLIVMTPRGNDRLPRPSGHSPAGHGQAGRRDGIRQRNCRARCRRARTSSARSSRASSSRSISTARCAAIAPSAALRPRPCIFEHVYFSRPDSIFNQRSVYECAQDDRGRTRQGRAGPRPTWWSPCPTAACRRRSATARNRVSRSNSGSSVSHYVGRTFIQPSDGARHASVKRKHNANRALVEGKRIVLIDDSIVRGTTSLKIVADDARRRGDAKCTSALPARPPGTAAITASTRRSGPSCSPDGWTSPRCASLSRPTASPSFRSTGSIAPSDSQAANEACPQYCDACFTGDYPTSLTDLADRHAPRIAAKPAGPQGRLMSEDRTTFRACCARDGCQPRNRCSDGESTGPEGGARRAHRALGQGPRGGRGSDPRSWRHGNHRPDGPD